MPSPGVPAPPRSSLEDSYLELLTDTLETLDLPARGQFLQRYLRAVTHLDLRESQCLQLWEEIITRRRQLSEALHRTVSLKTALMDVFSTAGLLRVPVLIEYDELKKLNLNAVTDSLTELYNRRVFNEFFERELNRAKRYNQPLGLVMMDMHRFKEVNDKHGHPRGDEVLRMAAATLKKALRTSDFAFRIGGDEFALVLPQTDAPQAHALSRRVETVFADTLKSLQLNVTVGMDYGVANYPQDADTTEELVRIADERLYQRKHAHRGRPAESSAPRPVETTPTQPPVTPPAAERPASAPAPPPISIESKRPPEKQEEAAPPATSQGQPEGSKLSSVPKPPRTFTTPRKAERVSMTGTNAYAVLGEQGARRARVLDLGFGGVALELDSAEGLTENILAVLHVPILPPVRVNLKPVWSQRTNLGYRVGCTFVN
ncbi:MAG TPA: diguanylate cyclase [Methylomirabilota bacterium]|jgi:diguanylate cyclase (GGDEF)-like protein|nr:diguanylate cyclase [Methylomirabilota bacterium]